MGPANLDLVRTVIRKRYGHRAFIRWMGLVLECFGDQRWMGPVANVSDWSIALAWLSLLRRFPLLKGSSE